MKRSTATVDPNILIALLGSLATILCTVLTVKANHSKMVEELDKHNAIQDERQRAMLQTIDRLSQQVERHSAMQEKLPLLSEKIDNLSMRIDKLEKQLEEIRRT